MRVAPYPRRVIPRTFGCEVASLKQLGSSSLMLILSALPSRGSRHIAGAPCTMWAALGRQNFGLQCIASLYRRPAGRTARQAGQPGGKGRRSGVGAHDGTPKSDCKRACHLSVSEEDHCNRTNLKPVPFCKETFPDIIGKDLFLEAGVGRPLVWLLPSGATKDFIWVEGGEKGIVIAKLAHFS